MNVCDLIFFLFRFCSAQQSALIFIVVSICLLIKPSMLVPMLAYVTLTISFIYSFLIIGCGICCTCGNSRAYHAAMQRNPKRRGMPTLDQVEYEQIRIDFEAGEYYNDEERDREMLLSTMRALIWYHDKKSDFVQRESKGYKNKETAELLSIIRRYYANVTYAPRKH